MRPAQTGHWIPSVAVQAHGRPSVAVIPFQLRSDDPRFESIGDGLADDVIASLSRMADFFVISRLSSMAFRKAPLGVRRIGELAKLPPDRAPTRRDWSRLSSKWTARIDERIAELYRLRAGLTECIGCGCLSLDRCKLSNPDDRAASLGPGPRYWVGDRPVTKPSAA